ncbi:MAG: RNA polymerase sigma factor [Dehalococcoidia bacterium]
MDDFRLTDDIDLVASVAAGREPALAALYDRYHRQCFSFALRILSVEGDAEEAVQETFVRLWRSAGQYDQSKASVGGWVLSITRNLCIDELRRRRRRSHEVRESEDAPERPAADRTDLEAERAIMGEQVRAALKSLPPEQRSAIELVYFHGLTSQEVGEVLGVPSPTVRSRLRLGLLKLAGILQRQGVTSLE